MIVFHAGLTWCHKRAQKKKKIAHIAIHAELMQIDILLHELQVDNIGCPPVQLITKQ